MEAGAAMGATQWVGLMFVWNLISGSLGVYVTGLVLLLLSKFVKKTTAAGTVSSKEVATISVWLKDRMWLCSARHGDEPAGFVLGPWFFADVAIKSDSCGTIWYIWVVHPVWVRPNAPQADPLAAETKELKALSDWIRLRRIDGLSWFNGDTFTPSQATKEQAAATSQIVKMARLSASNGFGFNLVVYVHGPPGVGKSSLGGFVAAEVGGTLCTVHTPTEAGDDLETMLVYVRPRRDKPLVLVLNEWDRTVEMAYRAGAQVRQNAQVYDKRSYTAYMDMLSRSANVITILTANREASVVDPDGTALRPGRVDLQVSMKDVDAVREIAGLRFAPRPSEASEAPETRSKED